MSATRRKFTELQHRRVRRLIKDQFGVSDSSRQVRRIARAFDQRFLAALDQLFALSIFAACESRDTQMPFANLFRIGHDFDWHDEHGAKQMLGGEIGLMIPLRIGLAKFRKVAMSGVDCD